ncbi:hypothetical protein X777_02564 [Ooceraea biroi]|uniref:Uncharacterized protein n=1 Tax=Ooceraea biroi TaxID=2015173 RepID=A0A026WMZ3_OOCBI|nr:hypothetical protein X777_02564 [Ooceraea biroi]
MLVCPPQPGRHVTGAVRQLVLAGQRRHLRAIDVRYPYLRRQARREVFRLPVLDAHLVRHRPLGHAGLQAGDLLAHLKVVRYLVLDRVPTVLTAVVVVVFSVAVTAVLALHLVLGQLYVVLAVPPLVDVLGVLVADSFLRIAPRIVFVLARRPLDSLLLLHLVLRAPVRFRGNRLVVIFSARLLVLVVPAEVVVAARFRQAVNGVMYQRQRIRHAELLMAAVVLLLGLVFVKLSLRRVQILLLDLVPLLLQLHVVRRHVILDAMRVVQLSLVILVSRTLLKHFRRYVIAFLCVVLVAVLAMFRAFRELFRAHVMGLVFLLAGFARCHGLIILPHWQRRRRAICAMIAILVLRLQQLVPATMNALSPLVRLSRAKRLCLRRKMGFDKGEWMGCHATASRVQRSTV